MTTPSQLDIDAIRFGAALRHMNKSGEFAQAVDEMTTLLVSAQKRRADLLVQEDQARFGDGDLAAIRADLAQNTDEIDDLEKAIAGASRRRDSTRQEEAAANLEALGEQSREMAAEFAKRWETASKHIAIARREMLASDPLHTKLMANNQVFESARRLDLKVNLKTLKREAVGDPGPVPVGVSRAAIDMDHSLREEVHPRHPGRRTPAGAIRNRKGTPL